jgi:hypothetical protein
MFIRQLLLTEWNPIDVPLSVEDEYESYAMGAFGIILQGGDVEQVIDYLWLVETKNMALSGNRPRAEAVGRKLDAGVRHILGVTSEP